MADTQITTDAGSDDRQRSCSRLSVGLATGAGTMLHAQRRDSLRQQLEEDHDDGQHGRLGHAKHIFSEVHQ